MSYQDDNTFQILTTDLRKQYLIKANKRVKESAIAVRKFAEDNGLDFPFERLTGQDDGYHVYIVAEKMWKADGYHDAPSQFTRISERENKALRDFLTESVIADMNSEMDRSFRGNIK